MTGRKGEIAFSSSTAELWKVKEGDVADVPPQWHRSSKPGSPGLASIPALPSSFPHPAAGRAESFNLGAAEFNPANTAEKL